MATYSTSEKTRQAFIKATGELAAERGFSDISIRLIAERAGENISGIHYHFGSKEKLFEEVVRAATKKHRENPSSKIFQSFQNELNTPEGQSKALKAVIHGFIVAVFSPKNPWWHSYIPYQIMQSENPLQKILKEEIITPDVTAIREFVKRVKPEFGNEKVMLYTKIIQGSIIMHTHDIEDGLLGSGRKYSLEYLQELERVTIRQNQFLLGLPFL
ncbi:MAG: TetR/AcrR family transcriptional regulator [Lentisphaeria bacterium]